jgi:electron transfer flavoprotein beta subunit
VKIVVLLKAVARLREDTPFDPERGWIDEAGLEYEPNSYDLFALEAALRLVESAGDGEVVVACVGGDCARKALATALEIGAHRVVLIDDSGIENADSCAVASLLAGLCRREAPDLVLAGFMSDDRNAAAVGPMVAEFLSVPSATGIVSIETVKGGFRVERELESGACDTVELSAPCLATVQTGLAEVRYPTLKAIVAARKKPLERVGAHDLDVAGAGARVRVASIAARPRGDGTVLDGPVADVVAGLLERLTELRLL